MWLQDPQDPITQRDKAAIKRSFPMLWIQQTGTVCSLFASDLLMQEKQFWVTENRTKDMQCSQVMTETRSHRKSGLQCRKLRHLWDHPWFPIITLVAWHLAHWALIWPRV